MIQLYTDESKIEDGIFIENFLADNYFNTIVFNELDFNKYDDIIRELELQLCYKPEDLVIDYDRKMITNSFGKCSFLNFGNSAKLLFCYIYFSGLFNEDPDENNKLIFDFTSCGNNVLNHLFDFMNVYKVPIVIHNYTFVNTNKNNYIYALDEYKGLTALQCSGYYYYARVFKDED